MQNDNIRIMDILKNIWFNKVYRLVFGLVLVFSFFTHTVMHKFVFEQFYDELMKYVLNEAKQTGNHIAVHQNEATKNEVLQVAMQKMLKDFDIEKIKLFDKDGIVIHSTNKEDEGTKNNHDYFYNNVQKGEIFYKVVKSGSNSLEGEKQLRDVAEIYVPIMDSNRFIGASEIYYDITEKRASLDKLIEDTDRVFMFVIFISQFTIFGMLYFVSKNNLMKKINDRKAKEIEDLMHKQARSVALADMIGNVAHHWRQPLSIITTAITGLKVSAEFGNEIRKEDVEKVNDVIVKTAQTLSNTIDCFKDFISDEKQKEVFNATNCVNKSIELLKVTNKDFDANFELSLDDKINIYGIESELFQVIVNILTNSYEAYNKENIENRKIKIVLEKNENFVNLKIIDNAGGMDSEIIDKIFDPYFTTKHQYQDTGLGLFICLRIIVDNFDGNIICKNIDIKSEKGCEFLITIPVQVS